MCEGYWPLPEGAACPKHEVPLGPAAGGDERARGAQGGAVAWRAVGQFNRPAEAEAARLRLEAEGIRTFLDNTRMASHGMLDPSAVRLRVMVPEEEAQDARILLDQTWSYDEIDDETIDPHGEELGPSPGDGRRAVMRVLIVVLLGLPLATYVLETLIGLLAD